MTIFSGRAGSGTFSVPGVDPTQLYSNVQSIPQPGFRLGTVAYGSDGSSFVFVKLVLAGVTDILPGQLLALDKDWAGTLATNAAATLNQRAVLLQCFRNAAPAGTYWLWAGMSGNLAAKCTGTANGFGETTGTAGLINFAASATASQKSVTPTSLYVTNFTFTANTLNGSPTITNVSAAAVADLQLGALISGTGVPGTTAVGSITKTGGTYAIGLVSAATGGFATSVNATATGTAITMTITGTLPANVSVAPTFNKQN